MIVYWLLSIFFLICSTSNAKSFYANSVTDSGTFSKEYKTKFLKNVNLFNQLQAEINKLPYKPDEITAESLEADVEHKPMENPYLFEGDIMLNDEQWNIIIENVREELKARQNHQNESSPVIPKKRAIMSDPKYRWTSPIPFFINNELNASLIVSVINLYRQETCLKFKRHTELMEKSKPGLRFIQDLGCYSAMGKQPSQQIISIGIGCERIGTIWHEIAHALGVYHEQSRYDRDNYVTINYENIMTNADQNFLKHPADDYGIDYDYGSVMHYHTYAFSKNNKPTMLTKDPIYVDTPGARFRPSFSDVKGINSAYCSSTCSNTLQCLNGGYINPSTCDSCNCPLGFGGKLCDVAATPAFGCGNGDLTATVNTKTISTTGEKRCYYLITAPAGARVFFKNTNVRLPSFIDSPCTVNYIEINYKGDFTKSGARTCFKFRPLQVNLSLGNRLLVIYQGDENSSFSMNYRADFSSG